MHCALTWLIKTCSWCYNGVDAFRKWWCGTWHKRATVGFYVICQFVILKWNYLAVICVRWWHSELYIIISSEYCVPLYDICAWNELSGSAYRVYDFERYISEQMKSSRFWALVCWQAFIAWQTAKQRRQQRSLVNYEIMNDDIIKEFKIKLGLRFISWVEVI